MHFLKHPFTVHVKKKKKSLFYFPFIFTTFEKLITSHSISTNEFEKKLKNQILRFLII